MGVASARSSMLRRRRRGLLLAVGLIVPFHPLDLLLGQASTASLAFESTWIAILVAESRAERARADAERVVTRSAPGV